MKIQLVSTDVNSENEFIQTVKFENNCIMDLLTDETVKKNIRYRNSYSRTNKQCNIP